MRSAPTLAATFASVLLIAAACAGGGEDSTGTASIPAGLERCPSGTAILTTPPVDPDQLTGWVPLGNLNPPGHTFPTNHQYLYFANPGVPGTRTVPLVAPGNVTITRARRTLYSPGGNTDYAVEFAACAEVKGELGHVTSIAPAVLAQLGAFDQGCQVYSPNPGLSVSTCYTRLLRVPIAAGDALGAAGPNPPSLDFSLWDSRIPALRYANPARWILNSDGFDDFHVVPASDYFAEPARSRIATKVGSFDGRVRRTILPLGGTIEHDVPGSAQGSWLAPSQPTHPETPHLAIAPDPVDPTRTIVSVGASQPGFREGSYEVSKTVAAFAESPAQITADGRVHCFQLTYGGVILLQLVDATTLRVEGRSGSITCETQQPLAFTAGATFDYRR